MILINLSFGTIKEFTINTKISYSISKHKINNNSKNFDKFNKIVIIINNFQNVIMKKYKICLLTILLSIVFDQEKHLSNIFIEKPFSML